MLFFESLTPGLALLELARAESRAIDSRETVVSCGPLVTHDTSSGRTKPPFPRGISSKSKAKEEERALNEWKNTLPGADLSVYSPLRGDFDHEHDNSAEEVGGGMVVSRSCRRGWCFEALSWA